MHYTDKPYKEQTTYERHGKQYYKICAIYHIFKKGLINKKRVHELLKERAGLKHNNDALVNGWEKSINK